MVVSVTGPVVNIYRDIKGKGDPRPGLGSETNERSLFANERIEH